MHMKPSDVLLLAAVVVIAVVQKGTCWEIRASEDSNVTVPCYPPIFEGETSYWMHHNFSIIKNWERFQKVQNNLTIKGILEEDAGKYACIILSKTGDVTQVSFVDVVVFPKPDYKRNAITGIVVAGVIVALVGLFALGYRLRWRPVSKKEDKAFILPAPATLYETEERL